MVVILFLCLSFVGQSLEWCCSVSLASLQRGIFCALSELGACLGTERHPLSPFASVSLGLVKALVTEPAEALFGEVSGLSYLAFLHLAAVCLFLQCRPCFDRCFPHFPSFFASVELVLA